MRLGPDFSRFGHDLLLEKIFLSLEKPNAGQNCFQTVAFFSFTFFLQHVSLTLFHLCPRRFWQSPSEPYVLVTKTSFVSFGLEDV